MSGARKRLRVDMTEPPPPVLPARQEVTASKPSAQLPAHEEEEFLLVEEDTTDSSLVITMEDSVPEARGRRRGGAVRRKRVKVDDEGSDTEEEEEEGAGVELEIDRLLNQALESKSRQHNLTTVNVRNILHEVITNEHVVAMMKAAINETEAVPPPFEPKMTRSRMKEVVQKGEVLPAWNISPVKKGSEGKAQFVDIPLADEDSSDEEYQPEDDDEDETAEDTFLESDVESTASSPRGSRVNRPEEDRTSPWQSSRKRARRVRAGHVSMGPPPPPKARPPNAVTDTSFLEELNAVEEELSVCVKPYQPLSVDEDVSLVSCRTRSKRPLTDVPLGQLEAELQAPDITPDMYDCGPAQEDRDWTDWLRGLILENEEECDDEDDPEYNFLADVDEPDLEDYRDDKAVRISKKEVNELMEELFETLKEDLAVDDEEDEETQEHAQPAPAEAEEPIRALRTVKEKLALLRRQQSQPGYAPPPAPPPPPALMLSPAQRATLQQQVQQHVQLLTQINLLTAPISSLQTETDTTTHFLYELDVLAHGSEMVHHRRSSFRSSNLQEALALIEEMKTQPISYKPQYSPLDAQGRKRVYPVMPSELAWLFATRSVFMHPELLPCWSLDPQHYCPRRNNNFTAAEDCLLVLGLMDMQGSLDPHRMVSDFVLRKTTPQIKDRIKQCCRLNTPDNIVKTYHRQRVVGSMLLACRRVKPTDQRPPVEKDGNITPHWLSRSVPLIHRILKQHNNNNIARGDLPTDSASRPVTAGPGAARQPRALLASSQKGRVPSGLRYPPRLPPNLIFRRQGFVAAGTPGETALPSKPPPPSSSSTPPTLPPPAPPSVVPASSSPRPLSTGSPPHRPLSPGSPLCRSPLPAPPVASAPVVSSPTPPSPTPPSPTPPSPTPPPPPLPAVTVLSSISQRYRTFARLGRLPGRPPPLLPRRPPPPPRHTTQPDGGTGETSGGEERGLERGERGDEGLGDEEREAEEGDEELGDDEGSDPGSPFRLVLSDSSPSHAGSVAPDDDLSDPEEEEPAGSSLWCDDESEDQRETDVLAFAQDYTNRLCQCVSLAPDKAERLLGVLERFERDGARACPVELYGTLADILDRWPQVLRDYAAFLTPAHAQHCGLVAEQRLFERSRTFLRHLEQSLGPDSSHFQEVVSVLQGSSAPDISKITFLLEDHPHLQEEFWVFLKDLHDDEDPPETPAEADDSISQNARNGCQRSKTKRRKGEGEQMGREEETEEQREIVTMGEEQREEEAELPLCATNVIVTPPTGETATVWTREEDRAILTACQGGGANRKTFRRVSTQLGKTASEVSNRFRHLMQLFHSCSVEDRPIYSQEAAPD